MVEALEAGAACTMVLDPPPAGPAYKIINFLPPKPSEIRKLDAGPTELSIKCTYCIQFQRGPHGVELYNLVYSDRVKSERVLPLNFITVKTDANWRMSSWQSAPEKDPWNVALLSRRRAKQLPFAVAHGSGRRDTYLNALLRRERDAAKRKAKAQRTKAVRAVSLADGGDDGSSSNSSSSSTA